MIFYGGIVFNQTKRGCLQLVVPHQLRAEIPKETHEGTSGGHLGQYKTLNHLKERFYWPGYFNDVRN